jgi:hypothetical protein
LGFPNKKNIPLATGNDNGIYLGVEVLTTSTAGTDVVTNLVTVGSTVGAILKMDADGNKIWLKSTTNNVRTWTILNNPNGSGVFCGGQIFGFLPIALGITSGNPSNGNAFLSKIDYFGTFQNSFSFSSGPIGSHVLSLTTDSLGVFYVGGKGNSTTPIFSCAARQANNGLFLGKFTEQPDRAPTPVVSAAENVLSSLPIFGGNIQWFLNGTAISGVNSQTFTVTQIGNYTVTYSLVEVPACVSTSTAFTMAALKIDTHNLIPFSVFPNPSKGIFAILTKNSIENAPIIVTDLGGRKVMETKSEL